MCLLIEQLLLVLIYLLEKEPNIVQSKVLLFN